MRKNNSRPRVDVKWTLLEVQSPGQCRIDEPVLGGQQEYPSLKYPERRQEERSPETKFQPVPSRHVRASQKPAHRNCNWQADQLMSNRQSDCVVNGVD